MSKTWRVSYWSLGDWSFFGTWNLTIEASFGNASGRRPVISVINRINSTHRFLAGSFFDYVRHEPGRSCDHENTVKGRGIHSQIGKDGPDGAVHIDRQRFLGISERFFN